MRLQARKPEEYKQFIEIIDRLKSEGKKTKEILEFLKANYPDFNPNTILVKYCKFKKELNNGQ